MFRRVLIVLVAAAMALLAVVVYVTYVRHDTHEGSAMDGELAPFHASLCSGAGPELVFFVAGHAYGRPAVGSDGLYEPLMRRLLELQPDVGMQLGVLTGDVVRDATPEAWDAVALDIDQIGVPIYISPGNHDLPAGDESAETIFNAQHGPKFQSFSVEDSRFVILDGNADGWSIRGPQLDLLEQALSAQDGTRRVFVFTHQVLWVDHEPLTAPVVVNSYAGYVAPLNFTDEIAPMLDSSDKEVYLFAGDVGADMKTEGFYINRFGQATLLASGMGNGHTDNFLLASVCGDGRVEIEQVPIVLHG